MVEVILDDPTRHNVLDRDGWLALADTFSGLGSDMEVGCVVVRGVGGRAFSAGSDIRAFAQQRDSAEDAKSYSRAIAGALGAIRGSPHPVLAVIEGVCVGGGLEIAACCDIRVCGESSRFGAPINRLGLTMAHAELAPLVELLGRGTVSYLLLTGELIGASEARNVGLVNAVHADGEVVARGRTLARTIAEGAPLVNRWHKRFIGQIVRGGELTRAEIDEALEAFATEDYVEGRSAFLEKRSPRFKGE